MAMPLRALIVEDSEDDAALVVRELSRGGFQVLHERVDSGAAMKAALEKPWDIVISDYSMPGFSGVEALEILRAKDSETPFLYVSGTIGEDNAVSALKSGAQDYLVKGKLTRLLPAIERELRDVQERRERHRLEVQVHQLQRFEAIGRLAGGIAHDFNNVIGAVLGWAEIGYQELPEGHKTRERLLKIQQQAKRASGLTRQLLAFARRQVLQPQNLDVNLLIKETVSLLAKIIGEQIQIELALAPDLQPAWADGTQIEQVIMNLCLNARDAMPKGGRIKIATQMVDISSDAATTRHYFRPGRFVHIAVADQGTGMDAQTLEHIFEPFFTTKEVGKGTGLGLATVYGIVKQHEGIIDVLSEVGKGTEFRIYLPPGSGEAQAAERRVAVPVKHGTETILIADDHEGVREAAREMLEPLGYNIILAGSGLEAVEIFENRRDEIDLVVLDVVMPTMTGLHAYEKMLVMKPRLRAVFTSGYTVEAESLQAMRRRGVSVLQKPYSSSDLGRQIRAVLDEEP
jgi:two-component system cell cycle sensor histidine kinase/response regulator CckA